MLRNQLTMIARAALFAVIAVGGMATGLSITTYTLSKANDIVVARVHTGPFGDQRNERMCVE